VPLLKKNASFQPFRQPENNAPKITYDFYASLLFGGSIKVITDFPSGTAVTTCFFLAWHFEPRYPLKKMRCDWVW